MPLSQTGRVEFANIGALLTMDGPDGRRPLQSASVVVENGRVTQVTGTAGPAPPSPANPYPPAPTITHPGADDVYVDCRRALVTPGLVDPHTHLLYGGNRSGEMALKLAGVPYLDILASGGGILATVSMTREAGDEELVEAGLTRLDAMLRMGTTTVEVKSGYGLSTEQELRMLRLIAELDRRSPVTVVPTLLGAHATPADHRDDPAGYVEEIVERMIPAVSAEGLAHFCDVFCEPEVFPVNQSRRILEAAARHGLARKVHADEIAVEGDISGAELAAEVSAVSADHLRATPDEGLERMAQAGVTPVLLPATSLCLADHRYAPARRMIDDFGLPVALATDCNPGTSPTESLQLVMAVAALELRLTPEEILAGVTVNAARAIDCSETAGCIATGRCCDLVVWQAYDPAMLPYRFGTNQAALVVKNGRMFQP